MNSDDNLEKKIAPFTGDLDDLVDIREVHIREELPKEERIADFIEQIKNPYLFRCGDIVVECVFSQKEATFADRLKQYMRML